MCLKKFLQLNDLSQVGTNCLALQQDRESLFRNQFHCSNPKYMKYTEFLRFILPNFNKALRVRIQQNQKTSVKDNKEKRHSSQSLLIETKTNFTLT